MLSSRYPLAFGVKEVERRGVGAEEVRGKVAKQSGGNKTELEKERLLIVLSGNRNTTCKIQKNIGNDI